MITVMLKSIRPSLALGFLVSPLLLLWLDLLEAIVLLGSEWSEWVSHIVTREVATWIFAAVVGASLAINAAYSAFRMKRHELRFTQQARPAQRSVRPAQGPWSWWEFVRTSLVFALIQLVGHVVDLILAFLSSGFTVDVAMQLLKLTAVGLRMGLMFSIVFLLWLVGDGLGLLLYRFVGAVDD